MYKNPSSCSPHRTVWTFVTKAEQTALLCSEKLPQGILGTGYLICSRPDWFGVPRIRHCNPLNFADCIQLYMVELVREASLRCNWQIIKTDQSESIS